MLAWRRVYAELTFEFLWMLIKLNYAIIKSVIRMYIPPAPKDVKEQIILITGAGHGIGRELALRFARLGAIVICVDINSAGNEETAKMIEQERGVAHTYQCDVSNRAAVMELANKVRRDVGDVTILVNNAGIMPCRPLLQQTEQEIRLMYDINVNGCLWMIQALLPAMISRNDGHIVAMSSMAGLMGLEYLVPYCGSKHAIRGIMEALALELHSDAKGIHGIKLTTICPFIVDTGLCKKPRIRFPNLCKIVDVNDAADMIVDAVRRELTEITVPHHLHYLNRFMFQLLPRAAKHVLLEFANTGTDPHDD